MQFKTRFLALALSLNVIVVLGAAALRHGTAADATPDSQTSSGSGAGSAATQDATAENVEKSATGVPVVELDPATVISLPAVPPPQTLPEVPSLVAPLELPDVPLSPQLSKMVMEGIKEFDAETRLSLPAYDSPLDSKPELDSDAQLDSGPVAAPASVPAAAPGERSTARTLSASSSLSGGAAIQQQIAAAAFRAQTLSALSRSAIALAAEAKALVQQGQTGEAGEVMAQLARLQQIIAEHAAYSGN